MSDTVERLARIETKLDMLLTRLTDHETRLRALEAWRWLQVGAAAAAGGAASKLVQMFA